MRFSSHKLSCEGVAHCFPFIVQVSHHKCRNICAIGNFVTHFRHKRTFWNQSILEPASESCPIINGETRNHPCKRSLYHSYSYQESESSQTYSVLKASCFNHWFKNWQELRKEKLTASTFAGAIGFWPHRRVQLWLEKIGAIEPFSGNLATCWSNIREEEALERYKLITGNIISFPEFQVYCQKNLEDIWLGASPDGVVNKSIYDLLCRGILEIKCPFFGGEKDKAAPWKRIPLYCIPQAQGLMEIMDRDWMHFYVWTLNGSSLFRIYRDVEYWDCMKIALSDFWWNHVQPAKELYSNNNKLKEELHSKNVIPRELKSLVPAPRHEFCSYLVYESKRIVDNSELLMCETNGIFQINHVENY